MKKPKILSIDDSKMIHSLIAKAFNCYEVDTVFALNGEEGIKLAKEHKPDMIILDITMPVKDGKDTLMEIKTDPELQDIPVVMLTAESSKEKVIEIARIGVRDYVVKPFTEQQIVERVGRVIDLNLKK